MDVDGMSRIFCADWARRDWNTSNGVGVVYLIRGNQVVTTNVAATPASPSSGLTKGDAGVAATDPWPDLHAMPVPQLVDQLSSRSAVRRREAQQELLHLGDSDEANSLLKNAISNTNAPLYARVAELFTLAQLMREKSHPILSTWVNDADLREFVLRALVDRDEQLANVDPHLFVDALNDGNPRVRVQAAIGLGRLRDPSLSDKLVPLTADKDWNVRHAAMQSLRSSTAPKRVSLRFDRPTIRTSSRVR